MIQLSPSHIRLLRVIHRFTREQGVFVVPLPATPPEPRRSRNGHPLPPASPIGPATAELVRAGLVAQTKLPGRLEYRITQKGADVYLRFEEAQKRAVAAMGAGGR